jgi:hypothetical protein
MVRASWATGKYNLGGLRCFHSRDTFSDWMNNILEEMDVENPE